MRYINTNNLRQFEDNNIQSNNRILKKAIIVVINCIKIKFFKYKF